MSHITVALSELRDVVRRWRRRPAAPLSAGLVLALGVGAAIAVFGVVNAALLRPLPYGDPRALVLATTGFPNMRLALGFSAPEALELGRLTTAFSGLGMGYFDVVPVTGRDTPVVATAAYVSSGMLDVLEVAPLTGRTFRAADNEPNSAETAVLGFAFWQRAFGADRGIVGRRVLVDGRPREIAGVMPAGFDLFGRRVEIWLPLRIDPANPGNRANHVYTVIARRRAGVTLEQARADVLKALAIWPDAVNDFHTPDLKFHPVHIADLTDVVRGELRPTVLLIAGAVLLVLLVASANAASLMVAQADRRAGDLAIATALGASRQRLLAASMVEGLLLGAGAALAGLALAAALTRLIRTQAPASLGALVPVFDMRVVVFSAGIAVATGVACGLAPLTRLRSAALAGALTAEGRSATASSHRQRMRRLFVGGEIAFALVLLSGSLLMIESLWRLHRVDPGFTPAGVLRAQVTLPAETYADRERIDQFFDLLRERLRATPGVLNASVMTGLPLDRRMSNTSFLPEGASIAAGHAGLAPVQYVQFASPGFFDVLHVPIVEGRAFTDADRRAAQPVAIVNQAAARAYWPDGRVIGRRIRSMAPGRPWLTVVGVAGDVRQGGLRDAAGTEVIVPLAQTANVFGDFVMRVQQIVVRTSIEPTALVAPLRQAVAALDPTLAVSNVEPMTEVVARAEAAPRLLTIVLATFGAIATLLSVTGVSGVVATGVAQRRREFAIRRSLGAGPGAIAALVLGQTRTTVLAGLLLGGAVAIVTSRWLLPFLFDVPAGSPSRLMASGALLAMVAAFACIAPLTRALRIDPARALRND